MTGRITQKEIARRLGVSQALVSRALTGTSAQIDASPVTVERIRKAAAGWDYRPSAAALTLKGLSSRTLGVVIKSFDDPYLGHLIGVLQGLARREGYSLLLAGWDESERGDEGVELFRKYAVDGLVLCGSDYRPGAATWYLRERKPVVQIGSGRCAAGVRQVVADEAHGLEQLVEYLVGLGHRRIALAGEPTPAHGRRERCLLTLLGRRGVRVPPAWVVRGASHGAADLHTAVKRLAGRDGKGPTAWMAADDATAQTILRALHESGVRVPEDVSLTGLDDIPAARTMIPALTTVRQPVDAIVQQAFRLVTGVEGTQGGRTGDRIVIAPELVVRESCAAPR
jgi:LacI family transcriptional regulator